MRASQYNEKEKAIFDYINETIRSEGYAPSVRDIQNAVGIKSTSTVHASTGLPKRGLSGRRPERAARFTPKAAPSRRTERQGCRSSAASGRECRSLRSKITRGTSITRS